MAYLGFGARDKTWKLRPFSWYFQDNFQNGRTKTNSDHFQMWKEKRKKESSIHFHTHTSKALYTYHHEVILNFSLNNMCQMVALLYQIYSSAPPPAWACAPLPLLATPLTVPFLFHDQLQEVKTHFRLSLELSGLTFAAGSSGNIWAWLISVEMYTRSMTFQIFVINAFCLQFTCWW